MFPTGGEWGMSQSVPLKDKGRGGGGGRVIGLLRGLK